MDKIKNRPNNVIYADRATSPQQEYSVNLYTQPSFDVSYQNTSDRLTNSSGWVDLDITDMVMAWSDVSMSNFCVVLRGPETVAPLTNNYKYFYTSHYLSAPSLRPELSMDYTVTPEPASTLLFGAGLLSIGFFRRKKRV